jgi:SAM-dependent methyltransferase
MIATGEAADTCAFCGGRRRRRYAMGEYDVRQCVRCGTGGVRPMPTEAELRAFYDGFLTHLSEKQTPVVRAAMARLFPDLGLATGRGLRMLDIGGGGGFYSRAFEDLGYGESTYVDLDPASCAFAREQLGLARVHHGDAVDFCRDAAAGPAGGFDFIYSRHLIEHLPDPPAFLSAVLTALAPGGMLVVQCPNGDSIEYLAYPSSTVRDRLRGIRRATGLAAAEVLAIWLTGGMLHGIDPPRHLWAITGGALAAWAAVAGLQCELRYRPLWDLAYSPGYRPKRLLDRFQAIVGRCVLAPLRGGAHLVAILRRDESPADQSPHVKRVGS